MLLRIELIVAFIVVPSLTIVNVQHAEQDTDYVYLVEKSTTIPERPMIVDLKNEQVFYSPLSLPAAKSYEIFYDTATQQFIIVAIKSSSHIDVYLVDAHEGTFPEPVFTSKAYGKYTCSRCAWSQSTKTLCFTGQYHETVQDKRGLTLTCLKLDEPEVVQKTLDLSSKIQSDTGIWALSNQILVTGKKNINPNSENENRNIHLFIDIDNWVTKDIEIRLETFLIIGTLDQNTLVATDYEFLYSYNIETFSKTGDFRDYTGRIFSATKDNKSYFSQLYSIEEENGFQFEKMFLAKTPWSKYEKPIPLFKGERPGSKKSVVLFSEEPLPFKFTRKIRTPE